MLVLNRKQNEEILIGDDIRITIVETRRGQVRIGIDAPGDIPIMREELAVKLAASRQAKKAKFAESEHSWHDCPSQTIDESNLAMT